MLSLILMKIIFSTIPSHRRGTQHLASKILGNVAELVKIFVRRQQMELFGGSFRESTPRGFRVYDTVHHHNAFPVQIPVGFIGSS